MPGGSDGCSPGSDLEPRVTIRMNPSSVPDTRNSEWSPLKSVDLLLQRQQSGQLQYALSGFLSLQLEVQGFLGDAGRAPVELLNPTSAPAGAPFPEVCSLTREYCGLA